MIKSIKKLEDIVGIECQGKLTNGATASKEEIAKFKLAIDPNEQKAKEQRKAELEAKIKQKESETPEEKNKRRAEERANAKARETHRKIKQSQ